MKNIFFLIGLAFLLTHSSCKDDKKAELEKLKKQSTEINEEIAVLEAELSLSDTVNNKKIHSVIVDTIKPVTFKNYIQVQGKVDADENVSLSPEMPGVITKIHVKVGDDVNKDQVLAETDNKVILQGISELQNALDLATIVYEKQENLWNQKIGTEIQYLTAKNQKESLERKKATLLEQLDMTRIKSPINGVVDALDAKIGQMAAPGMPLIRVVNFNNLKVKAEVAEAYASSVKKGDETQIIFPDINDTVSSKIDFAAKVINPLTRTFSVQVNLGNKNEYRPNMIAVMRIVDYAKEKAIVVPVNIIQKTETGDYVMIAQNKRAKKVKVKTGKIYSGNAEIVEGLKEGDKLIVEGFQELNEDEEVNF